MHGCTHSMAWQLVTAIAGTSKISRRLALFSVLYVQTVVSPAALICHGYRWLLCHRETLLFDRHFAVSVPTLLFMYLI